MAKTRRKHKTVELRLLAVDFEADILLEAVRAYGASAKTAKTKAVCENLAHLIEYQIKNKTKED